MSDDALPEPDRVPGAPHPREALRVIGQDAAIADFVSAAQAHRLHHGWLISGPRGTGKATLAWSIAKWLLADGTSSDLTTDAEAPGIRRIRALSEPRLHLVRRGFDDKTGRLKAEIGVDDIRALAALHAAANGDDPANDAKLQAMHADRQALYADAQGKFPANEATQSAAITGGPGQEAGYPRGFAHSCASRHPGCSRGIRGKACRSKAGTSCSVQVRSPEARPAHASSG